MPLADADAEQARQRVHHAHGVGVLALFAHPGDGIQRIVQEMGVDLGLQRLEFGLAQVNLLLAHRDHQLLDAQHHMAEGVRKLPHLPRAAHRVVGEVVGVGLKALHRTGQAAQRPCQQAGQHPAGQQRAGQHQRAQHAGKLQHFGHVAVHQLVHIAHAHHAPAAAAHAVDAGDDRAVVVYAVVQPGQGGGVLAFQAGVDQLLLRVVDKVAGVVQQKAVAARADADIVDVAGQARKAQIQRDPLRRAFAVQPGGHGHDPGVVTVKDGRHMRRGHEHIRPGAGALVVKREVGRDLLLGVPPQGPAVQQLPGGVVAGHVDHIGPEVQKGVEHRVAPRLGLAQRLPDNVHRLGHIAQVVFHRVGHLRNRLRAAGAGVLHNGAAVAVQKQRNAQKQDDRHHAHHHRDQDAGDAHPRAARRAAHGCASAPACRRRRSALGDSPLYFLKQ